MEPHEQRLSSMLKQRKTENPMGAGKKQALRVTFDRRLKLEFQGSKVTSDAAFANPELHEYLEAEGLSMPSVYRAMMRCCGTSSHC
jgi:hypothetical protein